jgi:predicted transcriptional regulator
MTIWDDRILEILRDTDSGTPSELADEEYIKVTRQQVSRRLKKLNEHGLVKHLGNGVYVITERGEKYLDGEISTYEDEPDEIPESDEDNDGVPSPSSAG